MIKIDQFEEDFNQLEQIQKKNFDLLVKSFLVSFWKLPFDRVESILEFAPLLYLIMSLIDAQEYVAPIEKQDKKNSNVIRWLNKRLFPRIVAILENKPEQGLAMADGRCAKQVILEAIAQYIKVIEEKLPSYKDMALVFKIRNFFSEKLPSYIPEPEPEVKVAADMALDENKQEQGKLQPTKKAVTGLQSRQASGSIAIPAGVNLEPGAVLGSSKWQKLLQAIEQAKQLYADQQLTLRAM
ncbi:hypothetical protein, partial [Piscirickettsia salmonis]